MPNHRFEHEDFDVTAGGAALRVRRLHRIDDVGEKRPPIVFLHDSLGCITAWRDFPERLCGLAGRDGLIYDREGFGGSGALRRRRSPRYLHEEADMLGDLLGRCGIGAASLLGHSDGGTIALLAAARLHQVESLVTIGAHVVVEERTLDGLRDALPLWDDEDFRRRMERHHGVKSESVFRVWVETWLSSDFRSWQILDELAAVRCPALVIQGQLDEFATPEHVRLIVGALGGAAEAWIVEGAGHSPHRESDLVLDRCVEFFRRVPGD